MKNRHKPIIKQKRKDGTGGKKREVAVFFRIRRFGPGNEVSEVGDRIQKALFQIIRSSSEKVPKNQEKKEAHGRRAGEPGEKGQTRSERRELGQSTPSLRILLSGKH